MWWLYFHRGADQGHHRIAHSPTPGQHGMVAYTYLHLPIVAGIIVSAVADDLVLADAPHGGVAAAAVVIGGPMLYLTGLAAFKWTSDTRSLPPPSHIAGMVLLTGLAGLAATSDLPLPALHAATTATLGIVAVWEYAATGSDMRRTRW